MRFAVPLLGVQLLALDLHGAIITPLGYLPDRQGRSHADAISADGTTVVGYCERIADHSYTRRAFRWTFSRGMQDLGILPVLHSDLDESFAAAVSSDGSVVVGASNFKPFRWSASTGMISLGPTPNHWSSAAARAISADGSVIYGNGAGGAGFESFRSFGTGVIPLNALFKYPLGCSFDGRIAVGDGANSLGVRWEEPDDFLSLADLSVCTNYHFSRATAVSGDGRVIVGFSSPQFGSCSFFDENAEAVRWAAGGEITRLGTLPAHGNSSATAASANGAILGGYTVVAETVVSPTNPIPTTVRTSIATLWDESGTAWRLTDVLASQNAHLSYWKNLSTVTGVSSNGLFITGTGINSNGVDEAFRVRLDHLEFAPSITIRQSAFAHFSISWPVEFSGWQLEVAQALGSEPRWEPWVGNTEHTTNFSVTLPLQNRAFFRLRRR